MAPSKHVEVKRDARHRGRCSDRKPARTRSRARRDASSIIDVSFAFWGVWPYQRPAAQPRRSHSQMPPAAAAGWTARVNVC